MIDKASVFAERFRYTPGLLQASVMGQGTDPSLDPYTALRALQLIKESNAMMMARQAEGPTEAPSLAAQAVEPQGLEAMLPMGAPVGQMPQEAPQETYGGVASMPTPDDGFAGGGIVAFAGGGTPRTTYTQAAFDAIPQPTTMADREAGITEQQGYVQKLYGADRLAPYAEDIAKERHDLDSRKGADMGYALLAAAQAVVAKPARGRGLGAIAPALANAAGAFGAEMQKSDKDMREAKRLLRQSEITLATAQQARADGRTDKAIALFSDADKQKREAEQKLSDANMKAAEMEKGIEVANISARASMAAANKPSDMDKQASAIYDAMVAKDPSILNDPVKKAQAAADSRRIGAGEIGRYPADARVAAGENKDALALEKLVDEDETGKLLKMRLAMLTGKTDAESLNKKAEIERGLDKIRKDKRAAVEGAAPASRPAAPPVRGGAPIGPVQPSAAHISALKNNPTMRDAFDVKFGAGAAARILGN